MVNTVGDAAGTPTVPTYTYATTSTAPPPSGTGTRTEARAARVTYQNETAVADASGTVLITNDELGFGLDRPYLGWQTYPTSEETPTLTTSSGTFASLVTLSSEPQHPKLRVRVRVVNGAGTSSEVRLVDRATGTVISSILVVGSAVTLEDNMDGTLVNPILKSVGGVGAAMKVDVQARRTAGAGTVGLLVLHAVGKGT